MGGVGHFSVCGYACVHRCGGQRSILGVVPLVPCILFFETGSHADLKLAESASLAWPDWPGVGGGGGGGCWC